MLTDVDPRRKTRARELAEKVLARAIAMAPQNASAHYNYGRAVRETSVARALAAWDRALALEPQAELALQIHTQIAKARHDGADLEGADQAFKAALTINRTLRRRVPEASLERALPPADVKIGAGGGGAEGDCRLESMGTGGARGTCPAAR